MFFAGQSHVFFMLNYVFPGKICMFPSWEIDKLDVFDAEIIMFWVPFVVNLK